MSKEEYGLLKIGNEPDRLTIASILFKNGYEVKQVRMKKNGKSYEYYVAFRPTDPKDMQGGGDGEG